MTQKSMPPSNPNTFKEQLIRIQKLIDKERFRQAIPLTRKLLKEYPDQSAPSILLSLCQSQIGKSEDALKTLQAAEKRFPDHFDILYHIAETFIELKQYQKAEPYYRRSLRLTPPELKEERSECCVGLGVSLWEQHMRKEALEMWRLALKWDPNNEVARRNLEHLSNEYKEPSAPSKVFDDLYHFQKIHQERYLKQHGRKEFESLSEAERVMEAIRIAWNKHIAPLGKKVDAMTPAEKTELFSNVKFDF